MKNIIVAVAFVLSLSASANAIDWKKPELGVGIYNAMPQSGQYKDGIKSGMGMNLSADWQLQDMIMVGAELGYSYGQELKANSSYDLMSTVIGLRGKYVKPMDFGSKKGNLYGIVGLGYYMMSFDPSIPGIDDENKMGFSLGGGVDMEINSNMTAGFELRLHMIEEFTDLNPMLKVGYKF